MATVAGREESLFASPLRVAFPQQVSKEIADLGMHRQPRFLAGFSAPPGLDPPTLLGLDRMLLANASENDKGLENPVPGTPVRAHGKTDEKGLRNPSHGTNYHRGSRAAYMGPSHGGEGVAFADEWSAGTTRVRVGLDCGPAFVEIGNGQRDDNAAATPAGTASTSHAKAGMLTGPSQGDSRPTQAAAASFAAVDAPPHPADDRPAQPKGCTRSRNQDGLQATALGRGAVESQAVKQPKGKSKGKAEGIAAGRDSRWWTWAPAPLLCPLTKFPISLLPYPPFKFKCEAGSSSAHKLVDGKFLAMRLIANGSVPECGRELRPADVDALGEYIQRCKLGPFRPGRALALAKQVTNSEDFEQRSAARTELERFRNSARMELGKLKRIQENRLLQVAQAQTAQIQPAGQSQGCEYQT